MCSINVEFHVRSLLGSRRLVFDYVRRRSDEAPGVEVMLTVGTIAATT